MHEKHLFDTIIAEREESRVPIGTLNNLLNPSELFEHMLNYRGTGEFLAINATDEMVWNDNVKHNAAAKTQHLH